MNPAKIRRSVDETDLDNKRPGESTTEPSSQDIIPLESSSRLLQLPVELVLLISEHLSPPEVLLLSNTCRALYAIVNHRVPRKQYENRTILDLDRWDYGQYLFFKMRDLPKNKYLVCEVCLTRLPEKEWLPSRPKSQIRCSKCKGMVLSNCPFGGWLDADGHDNTYVLQVDRVKLALRYRGLIDELGPGNELQPHLDDLMKPWSGDLPVGYSREDLIHRCGFCVTPRFIDGRFLVHTEWCLAYEDDCGISAMDGLQLCSHNWFFNKHLMDESRYDEYHRTPLHNIFKFYTYLGHGSLRAGCSECHTDFEVEGCLDELTIRSWQDLGTGEDIPLPLWARRRSRHAYYYQYRSGSWGVTDTPRVPGSVYKLWNPEKEPWTDCCNESMSSDEEG
ncbi:hypothetical protein HIM_06841 [Hirsutella minnesotensis 3608]|uniref:F-box domain-containing protein n=1 Tax=Hirsutella minnesotensis 3608 TaxID=1043627 RepID=A0A0F7ZTU5_9HYPO|nr:hypothetical protein HIM_06841 [Hirsutella minnesotensis 3608]